jgi:DNA-binding CsgD family transcriptional regulator
MNAQTCFPATGHDRLSRSQLQVLESIAHGNSAAQAAGQLGISTGSVQAAMRVVRARLKARSDAHAVALAIANGQLDATRIRLVTDAANALGIGAR